MFLIVLLVAAWTSGSQEIICEQTKSGEEQCAPYNLAAYYLVQIKRTVDDNDGLITALATIVIAAFTGTLWKSTRDLGLAGDKQLRIARKAANAAKISAEAARDTVNAMIAAERPRVRLCKLTFSRFMGDADDPTKTPVITARFKNYGRSTAIILGGSFDRKMVGTLPEEPDYISPAFVQPGKTLAPGEEFDFPEMVFYDFGQYRNIDTPDVVFTTWLYVYGFVSYLDHLGQERKHGFAAFFMPPKVISHVPQGEQFAHLNLPKYTYDT
ncbi:hypothetical protein LB543_09375 [Mesorhizobium sp. ESP7-2]|uniref:hypothetical protein n=1 Tax=Mesorhizobium sp. ESP7-2 TaxID=2876622 RepID=UPI001CCEA5EA|nr:hypothetical protein [Mesorhizobium sp. ESP7-2]MBZ9706929.1 hypothetical protein [Mesorhizobium sp. ESP7-2]